MPGSGCRHECLVRERLVVGDRDDVAAGAVHAFPGQDGGLIGQDGAIEATHLWRPHGDGLLDEAGPQYSFVSVRDPDPGLSQVGCQPDAGAAVEDASPAADRRARQLHLRPDERGPGAQHEHPRQRRGQEGWPHSPALSPGLGLCKDSPLRAGRCGPDGPRWVACRSGSRARLSARSPLPAPSASSAYRRSAPGRRSPGRSAA